MSERAPLYSIGYGQRGQPAFLDLLRDLKVRYLVDVRSAPFSRYNDAFSRPRLQAWLTDAQVHYVFMGDHLGGRPDDPSVYVKGRVDYDRCRERPAFQEALGRLIHLGQMGRTAIMCSEERPQECHRTKLIGESLARLGVPFAHVDEQGRLRSHHEVVARLTGGQQTLTGTHAFTSRLRYQPPGAWENPSS